MKRFLVVLLTIALAAGLFAGSADAKKKKKKKPKVAQPVAEELTWYLRRDGEGCTDASFRYLSLEDGPDFDTGSCGNANYGIPAMALGADPIGFSTRAGQGVPIVLNATKEISGLIGVKSRSASASGNGVRYGIGDTTLHVELSGETGGETKTIGTADVDYRVTPGTLDQVYKVEFKLTPDAALDKVEFTSLTIKVSNQGESTQHGFYTTDDPASYFILGTWKQP